MEVNAKVVIEKCLSTAPNKAIEQAVMQGAAQRMLAEAADTRRGESVDQSGLDEVIPDALLRQTKEELTAREKALRKEIHETRQRLRMHQLQELEEAETKLKKKLNSLELKQEMKKLAQDEAIAKETLLRQQVRLVELRNEQLKNEKSKLELQDEILRQTKSMEELRQFENDSKQYIAALKETLENHSNEQRLHEQMANAEATLEEQRNRLLELETSLTEQRTRVDETGCRRQRVEEDLQTLRESLRLHEEQVKVMEHLLAETKDVVSSLEGTIADNRRKKAELTKAKEETEANNKFIEKKIAEMKILVNLRAEEHKKLERRMPALFRESAKLKEKKVHMKNEIETLKQRDAVLRAELQQLQTDHKRLQLDVERLREHVSRTTHEKEQAQVQLDAVLHELFRQTEKEAAARAEMHTLHENTAANLAAAREEICSLEEELAQARDRQHRLGEQQLEVDASVEKIKKKGWFSKKLKK